MPGTGSGSHPAGSSASRSPRGPAIAGRWADRPPSPPVRDRHGPGDGGQPAGVRLGSGLGCPPGVGPAGGARAASAGRHDDRTAGPAGRPEQLRRRAEPGERLGVGPRPPSPGLRVPAVLGARRRFHPARLRPARPRSPTSGSALTASGDLVKRNADGSTSVGWAGWTSSRLTSVINEAHRHGTRVVLTVQSFAWTTGQARNQSALLGSAAARLRLARQIAAAVRDRGADGVNLDFEPLASGRADEFVAFVRSLRSELDKLARGYQVTFDTTGWIGNYPIEAATAPGAADAVFVMGYDYRTAGSSVAGSIAPARRAGLRPDRHDPRLHRPGRRRARSSWASRTTVGPGRPSPTPRTRGPRAGRSTVPRPRSPTTTRSSSR